MTRADIDRLRERLYWLERILRDGGFLVADHLRSGLPRPEIEAVAAEVGLVFPEELIALYEWHDGTWFEEGAPPGHAQLPGHDQMAPLSSAFDDYWRWVADGDGDESLYERTWFPWLFPGHAAVTVVDCAGSPDVPAQVIFHEAEADDPITRSAPSVLAAVDQMIAVVERGIWAYDPRWGGPMIVADNIDDDLTLFHE